MQQGDPLPHPHQTGPGTRGARGVPAAVRADHADVQGVGRTAQPHGDRPLVGVLQRVGQRLLHDPVRGELHRRRDDAVPGVGQEVEDDLQAVGAGPLRQGAETVQGRGGGRLPVVGAVAQDADETAHLGQSLDTVLPDHGERVPGGVLVVQGERGRGVNGDRGQVVGDHVVQLPCHPSAFRGHRLVS
ncbi:hypothetical protein SHIRM173S_06839 [Streptomyces hirsutus]